MAQHSFSASISKSFGDQILKKIKFPYRLQFTQGEFAPESSEDLEVEVLSVDVFSSGSKADDSSVDADSGAMIESAIVGIVLDILEGRSVPGPNDPKDDLVHLIVKRIKSSGDTPSEDVVRKVLSAEDKLLSDAIKKMGDGIEVGVKWVKLWILKPPSLEFGNPIRLLNLQMVVQVKARICVKIRGIKFCLDATSPKIRLEGRELSLNMYQKGPMVLGRPKFNELKIEWRIKIDWKTIKIRFDVTDLVNGSLRRQKPIVVLDLSAFEVRIPQQNLRAIVDKIKIIGGSKTETGFEASTKVVST